jgi:hypothetical protein
VKCLERKGDCSSRERERERQRKKERQEKVPSEKYILERKGQRHGEGRETHRKMREYVRLVNTGVC